MPKKVPDDDRERILRTLREIVEAPGTGSRALAAKYAASMRLAKLLGLDVGPEPQLDPADVQAPDPMADLDELEALRRRRARR